MNDTACTTFCRTLRYIYLERRRLRRLLSQSVQHKMIMRLHFSYSLVRMFPKIKKIDTSL